MPRYNTLILVTVLREAYETEPIRFQKPLVN